MFRWIVGGAVITVVTIASGCGAQRAPRMTLAPTYSLFREEAAIGTARSNASVAVVDLTRDP